mmetsp:Transcript_23895/g.60435  ORF Transcript_23895/g.60435 Transcript_23895/m.60435 type:complete len:441 (-) Transcript_23895:255-1577(-)
MRHFLWLAAMAACISLGSAECDPYSEVCFAKGSLGWVVVGASNGKVLRSQDGGDSYGSTIVSSTFTGQVNDAAFIRGAEDDDPYHGARLVTAVGDNGHIFMTGRSCEQVQAPTANCGTYELSSWEQTQLPGSPTLNSVSYTDLMYGLIGGGSGTRGLIYRSVGSCNDLGCVEGSWQVTGNFSGVTITSVLALSDGSALAVDDAGNIRRSSDQGASWSVLNSTGVPLFDIDQGNSTYFVASGIGKIFVSPDSGMSWAEAVITVGTSTACSTDQYKGVSIGPDGQGIAVGGVSGCVLATQDSGQTWSVASVQTGTLFEDVAVFNEKYVNVTGWVNIDNYEFHYTQPDPLTSLYMYTWRLIAVDGTNAAIAVAGGNVVMRSTVGSPQSPATLGATWSASSVPGGISFKSVDALGYDVVSSASLLLPSLWALIAAGVSVLLLQL